MKPRTPTRVTLLVFLALLVGSPWAIPARADLPIETPGSLATRIVVWNMTGPAGLVLENTTIEAGGLTLPWRQQERSLAGGIDLAAGGDIVPEFVATPDGIELREDPSNHVANGDFHNASSWTYASIPAGDVSAVWDAAEAAAFAHSAASTRVRFDSMDFLDSNWSGLQPLCAILSIDSAHVGQIEGVGMMNLSLQTDAVRGCSPGVIRQGFVDWSGDDRLSLALNMSSEVNLSFYVTAIEGASSFRTTAQALDGTGWRYLEVNLAELGPSRTSLSSVTLHFEGESVPSTNVSIDDLRVGRAKVFDESAELSQTLSKTEATWGVPGSAILSFRRSTLELAGIAADLDVILDGPRGALHVGIPLRADEGWQPFARDVSALTNASGTYRLSFNVAVSTNTSAASSLRLLLDDVVLRFPNRRNATFVSAPIDLGTRSYVDNVTWAGSAPGVTSVQTRVFGTELASPAAGDWALLAETGSPGTYDLGPSVSRQVRFETDLRTGNASESPRLEAFAVVFRHRAATGSVTTLPFHADPDFLFWRTALVVASLRPGTSIALEIENGTSWIPVQPPSDLTWHNERRVRARAVLQTADTAEAPRLLAVSLVYDYQADVVTVVITPGYAEVVSGESATFVAEAEDAGGHANGSYSIDWDTDNPRGHITNAGVFMAGEPGEWSIIATVRGLGLSTTITAKVLPAPLLPAQILLHPYLLAALAAVGGGYVAYQVVVRRLYAVDDIFVIARDGRLIMHNTRRMRADRDEDILAAMLTAISAFARDSEREENGDLRQFVVGGKTSLVERGRDIFVAAIYTGRVPRWAGKDLRQLLTDMESRFGVELRTWTGDPKELQGIKDLTQRFVSRTRYRGGLRQKPGAA